MNTKTQRQVRKIGGSRIAPNTTVEVGDPRYSPLTGEDLIIVNPAVIAASRASAGSVASIAVGASIGSVASIASVSQRASYAIEPSQGSVVGAASYGSVASIASQAALVARFSVPSQGSASGIARASQASIASISSFAGAIFIELPAIAIGEPIHIIKKGSAGTVTYRASDAKLVSGVDRKDITTEHQVDFLAPSSTDWSKK